MLINEAIATTLGPAPAASTAAASASFRRRHLAPRWAHCDLCGGRRRVRRGGVRLHSRLVIAFEVEAQLLAHTEAEIEQHEPRRRDQATWIK